MRAMTTEATEKEKTKYIKPQKPVRRIADDMRYFESLSETYNPHDKMLDPTGLGNSLLGEPTGVRSHHVLGVNLRKPLTHLFVLDIESWAKRCDIAHLIVLTNTERTKNAPNFYKVGTPLNSEDYYTNEGRQYWVLRGFKGVINFVENFLKQKGSINARILAHNGSKFDYIGLAWGKGVDRHNEYPKMINKKPVNPFTGEEIKKWNGVKWNVTGYGKKGAMYAKKGHKCVSFYDSVWHLSMPLSALGAKGITPLQYINPPKWLRENGFKNPSSREALRAWFTHLDQEAVDYCVQDCTVLADAVEGYRKVFFDHFGIDPWTYQTASMASLSAMIANDKSAQAPYKGHLIYKILYWNKKKPVWGWDYDKSASDTNYERTSTIPIAIAGTATKAVGGWYCFGKYVQLFRRIQFGGRCEVFAPRNRPDTTVHCYDAVSMYPSQMATQRFIDPRYIKELKEEIKGSKAILEFLTEKSGMFTIECDEPLNGLIKKYPVFPIRMSGDDFDERLNFCDWKGKIKISVTGEELRYFLEQTAVKNDDIRILPHMSFYSQLLNHTPMGDYAKLLYKERRKAKRNGDHAKALYLKLLMNTGYGTLVQTLDEVFDISPQDQETIDRAIMRMKVLDPTWSGWKDNEGEDQVKFIARFCADHYRPFNPYTDNFGKKWYLASLPSQMAPHAIRPWGCQITAYARIALHKMMMCALRAGYMLMYSDTDSVWIAAPVGHSVATVEYNLNKANRTNIKDNSVIIGDDLGQWSREEKFASPDLISISKAQYEADKTLEKPDVTEVKDGDETHYKINNPQAYFLGSKNYHLTDTKGNVLSSTIKGIPRYSAQMRAALLGWNVNISNLGDRRGINPESIVLVNADRSSVDGKATGGIGHRPRRIYENMYDSKAITLSQPDERLLKIRESTWDKTTRDASWLEYLRLIANTLGKGKGLRQAFIEYKKNKIKGHSYIELRGQINDLYKKMHDMTNTAKKGSLVEADLLEELERSGLMEQGMSALDEETL